MEGVEAPVEITVHRSSRVVPPFLVARVDLAGRQPPRFPPQVLNPVEVAAAAQRTPPLPKLEQWGVRVLSASLFSKPKVECPRRFITQRRRLSIHLCSQELFSFLV